MPHKKWGVCACAISRYQALFQGLGTRLGIHMKAIGAAEQRGSGLRDYRRAAGLRCETRWRLAIMIRFLACAQSDLMPRGLLLFTLLLFGEARAAYKMECKQKKICQNYMCHSSRFSSTNMLFFRLFRSRASTTDPRESLTR